MAFIANDLANPSGRQTDHNAGLVNNFGLGRSGPDRLPAPGKPNRRNRGRWFGRIGPREHHWTKLHIEFHRTHSLHRRTRTALAPLNVRDTVVADQDGQEGRGGMEGGPVGCGWRAMDLLSKECSIVNVRALGLRLILDHDQ